MLGANIYIYKLSWNDTIQYLERLEITSKIKPAAVAQHIGTPSAAKKPPAKDESKKAAKGKSNYCSVCKKNGHPTEKCWFRDGGPGKPISIPGNAAKKQRTEKTTGKAVTYTQQQVNAMLAALPMFQGGTTKSTRKRKVRYASSDEDDDEVDPSATAFFTNKLVHYDKPTTSDACDLLYSFLSSYSRSLASTKGSKFRLCRELEKSTGSSKELFVFPCPQYQLLYFKYMQAAGKPSKLARIEIFVPPVQTVLLCTTAQGLYCSSEIADNSSPGKFPACTVLYCSSEIAENSSLGKIPDSTAVDSTPHASTPKLFLDSTAVDSTPYPVRGTPSSGGVRTTDVRTQDVRPPPPVGYSSRVADARDLPGDSRRPRYGQKRPNRDSASGGPNGGRSKLTSPAPSGPLDPPS